MSRVVVEKHVYLSKAGGQTVEVWDKKSERMVDCIDCFQLIRYTNTQGPHTHSCLQRALMIISWDTIVTHAVTVQFPLGGSIKIGLSFFLNILH